MYDASREATSERPATVNDRAAEVARLLHEIEGHARNLRDRLMPPRPSEEVPGPRPKEGLVQVHIVNTLEDARATASRALDAVTAALNAI